MGPESTYMYGEYVPQKRGGGKKKLVLLIIVLAALAIAALILFLVQALNKTPATAEEFIAAVEERGLAWEDNRAEFSPEDQALLETGICARAGGWQAEFYQLAGTSAANRYFSSITSFFDAEVPSPRASFHASAGSYAAYSLTAPNCSYYFVSCIGSTVLLAIADDGCKGEAKALIKALGY